MSFFLGGIQCKDPKSLRRNRHALKNAHLWLQKCNTWRTTVGPMPGRGWVLMERGDLLKLNRNSLQTLTIQDDFRTIKFPHLIIGDAFCVSAGFEGAAEAPYVVELTDLRHLAQRSFISKAYNVRAPNANDHYQDSTNGGAPWTWLGMLEDLWTEIAFVVPEWGAFPLALGGALTPIKVPDNFRFHGVSAWTAFNEVLRRLGWVFALNPYTGAPALYQAGGAVGVTFDVFKAESPTTPKRFDDYYPIESPLHKVAATVRVCFHKQRTHYGSEKSTGWATGEQDSVGAGLNGPVYYLDFATGVAGVRAGSAVTVFDDMPAIIPFTGGAPSNLADLLDRGDERRDDYLRSHVTGGVLRWRQYAGFLKDDRLRPSSQLTGLAFFDTGGGWITEIIHLPQAHERASELNRFLQTGYDWRQPGGGLANERLQPPDLGRQSYPLYPPLTHDVSVTSSTAVDTGVYPGQLQRINAGTSPPSKAGGENVYVYSTAGDTLVLGNEFASARLVGVFDKAGTIAARPLYAAGMLGAGGAGDVGQYGYTTSATPDGSGLYDALLATKNADGTLTASATAIWLREANAWGLLFNNFFYHCHLTGFANGRNVYTVDDSDFTVANESFTQYQVAVLFQYFVPDECWDIDISYGARTVRVKRLLDVYDSTIRNTAPVHRIIFHHVAAVTDADFDVTEEPAPAGRVRVKTNGFTGTVGPFYRSVCLSGQLITTTSPGFPVVRGLVKDNIASYA